MKLNVGCGEFPAAGWLNIDCHRGGPVQPDVVADARALPLADGACDSVYLGHVLEHLPEADVVLTLVEARRVLSADGVIMVVAPDLTRAEAQYPEAVSDIVHGAGRWDGDAHLWDSRAADYPPLLTAAGLRFTEVPITAVDARWPVVSRIGWQVAYEAVPRGPLSHT